MDESRKAYEEWFRSRYGSLSIPPKQRLVMRTYSWAAWQAARASFEVDLAPANLLKCDGRDVVEILKYHGIKVKE